MPDERVMVVQQSDDDWADVEQNLVEHIETCRRLLRSVQARENGEVELLNDDFGVLVECGFRLEVDRTPNEEGMEDEQA